MLSRTHDCRVAHTATGIKPQMMLWHPGNMKNSNLGVLAFRSLGWWWRSTNGFPGYSDQKWRQCPHHVSYTSPCWGWTVLKPTHFRAGHKWLYFDFLFSPARAKSISNPWWGAQGNLPSWATYRSTPNTSVWACMGCLTWLPKKASNSALKQHKQTNTIFLPCFVGELQVNSNTHNQLDSHI